MAGRVKHMVRSHYGYHTYKPFSIFGQRATVKLQKKANQSLFEGFMNVFRHKTTDK